MQNVKRRNTYLIIAILVVQLLLSLFVAGKKNYLFFDEVFSYISANNIDGSSSNFKEISNRQTKATKITGSSFVNISLLKMRNISFKAGR